MLQQFAGQAVNNLGADYGQVVSPAQMPLTLSIADRLRDIGNILGEGDASLRNLAERVFGPAPTMKDSGSGQAAPCMGAAEEIDRLLVGLRSLSVEFADRARHLTNTI